MHSLLFAATEWTMTSIFLFCLEKLARQKHSHQSGDSNYKWGEKTIEKRCQTQPSEGKLKRLLKLENTKHESANIF